MGYWTFGGIVAASVVAVAVIVACLIYCLCHNAKGRYSCCGDTATGTAVNEKPPPQTALKNKGKITVDYTALYDKKHRGRGVHPKDQPAKDPKEDPVKTQAKKSGWYDSVMWYTMKNKKHRKPSMADALNEEMSQTSSSHQSSSTATSTSTNKADEDELKKGRNEGGARGERRSGGAGKLGGGIAGGAGKRGGSAPSELSVSTVESDRAG